MTHADDRGRGATASRAVAGRARRRAGIGGCRAVHARSGGRPLLSGRLAVTTPRFLTLDNARAILASAAFVGITAVGATHGDDRRVRRCRWPPPRPRPSWRCSSWRRSSWACGDRTAGRARWPASRSPRCRARSSASGTPNPIVLTIAAGFAIGGVGHLVQRRDTGLPRRRGVRRAQLHPAGPAAGRVRPARASRCSPNGLLRRTTAGRQMYLVGENRAAARAAGLPVGRVTVIAWAVLRRVRRADRRSSSPRSTPPPR